MVIAERGKSGNHHPLIKPVEVNRIGILPNKFFPKKTSLLILNQMRRGLLGLTSSANGEHTVDLVHVATEGEVKNIEIFGDSERIVFDFSQNRIAIIQLGQKDVGHHVVTVNAVVGFTSGIQSRLRSLGQLVQSFGEQLDSRGKLFVGNNHRKTETNVRAADRNRHKVGPNNIASLPPEGRASGNRSPASTDRCDSTEVLRGEIGEDLGNQFLREIHHRRFRGYHLKICVFHIHILHLDRLKAGIDQTCFVFKEREKGRRFGDRRKKAQGITRRRKTIKGPLEKSPRGLNRSSP